MPNHVTNQIEFYGNQKNINKVFKLIKGDNGYIDFNKIPGIIRYSGEQNNFITLCTSAVHLAVGLAYTVTKNSQYSAFIQLIYFK